MKDSAPEFPLWPGVPERTACSIRASTRIPAASASSPTSRAASRTRSSRTRSTILCNLEHRGAVGADPRAGDGAGILVQTPHKFFARKAAELGIALPEPGHYAVGVVFMPHDPEWRKVILDIYAEKVPQEGLSLLGWREVPHDNSSLGEIGEADRAVPHAGVHRRAAPTINDRGRVRAQALHPAQGDLRRRLPRAASGGSSNYYVVSLSCRTVIYKGMFLADQLGKYYPDLHEPDFETALCLVHQRFSTNTFPSWPLAHPYRMVAHNGEINTLRGNVNWMAARQASVSSKLFGDDITKLWPISYEGQSDTACFDNALEFLTQGGYSLAHAAMMLIPEAWAGNPLMDDGAQGVLRVSRRADGAVGRPGGDRVHRRPPDRRDARPQRPAPGALVRHRGRPRHHGVGSRRAADPGKRDRAEVAPAAGQDAAGRPAARPHHLRRGDQGAARQEAPLREVAEEDAARAGGPAGAAAAQARAPTSRCSIASSASATRRKTCSS